MMNDWRDQPYTYENNNSLRVNLAAAAVVALGFITIGTFAYETGGSHLQNMQAVASNPFAPLAAKTTSASPAPDSPSGLTSPELSPATAEPLQNAETDTPPVTAPARPQATGKPLQNAEADSAQESAPAKSKATNKLVKLSRAQRKALAAPEVEPVQFSAPAPEPQPAEVAPVETVPAETAPLASEHTDAPPQEAPAPAPADVSPQQDPPANEPGPAGAEAAPQ